MALWLYQGSPREPRELPPAFPRTGSRTSRWLDRLRHRRWGYWGDPGRADVEQAGSRVDEELKSFSLRLRAWIEGANPDRVFGSWHALLPSNRTTFLAWLLFVAILILALVYVRSGLLPTLLPAIEG
jgi:hypothetical protein